MAYEGMTLRFEPSSPEGVDLAKHEEQLGGQLKVRISSPAECISELMTL